MSPERTQWLAPSKCHGLPLFVSVTTSISVLHNQASCDHLPLCAKNKGASFCFDLRTSILCIKQKFGGDVFSVSVTNNLKQGEGQTTIVVRQIQGWSSDHLNFYTQMFPSVKVREIHITSLKFFPQCHVATSASRRVFACNFIYNSKNYQHNNNSGFCQTPRLGVPAFPIAGHLASDLPFHLYQVAIMGQKDWSPLGGPSIMAKLPRASRWTWNWTRG